eukprot:evm.model.scf_301.8 EVM.evm.TU.scf_301.8   scf_301:87517-89785(-)
MGEPTQRRQSFNSAAWVVRGVKRTLADDFQHMAIEMAWPNLCALVASVYMAVSLVFAMGFFALLRSDRSNFSGQLNPAMTDFEECFWMSVAHVVTIGYGGLLPASRLAYLCATLEHFMGILLSALLLGIVVTKASLPAAKIVFSDVVMCTTRDGAPVLIFRVANTRGNFLVNPDIRVSAFKQVKTAEGEEVWIGSALAIQQPPVMAPCFNMVHKINRDSPLFGMSPEEVLEAVGSISASIGATDIHSLQTLYATKLWSVNDIRLRQRFADVLKGDGSGPRILDMRDFNKYMPIKGASDMKERRPSLKEEPPHSLERKQKGS